MIPNIFDISTKELSQDAFITWLILWAHPENNSHDQGLNKCGVDFVNSLLQKSIEGYNEEIKSIRAGRQWENIDVWAIVNEKYLIIIEDKTFTERHSNQLNRYKTIAQDWIKENLSNSSYLICIYLKTGNESRKSLNQVKNKGFYIYERQEFLHILNSHELKNDIYNDFKSRLFRIERYNKEWENKNIKEWNGDDWQGFFQYIEQENNIIDWFYVNNPNGGFWNAILNWDLCDKYPIFIQTEEYKLCFKISTNPADIGSTENINRSEIRNKFSKKILDYAKELGRKEIRKPKRFGNGKYMTVAVVDSEYWLGNINEIIDKRRVANNLNEYLSFLKETIN